MHDFATPYENSIDNNIVQSFFKMYTSQKGFYNWFYKNVSHFINMISTNINEVNNIIKSYYTNDTLNNSQIINTIQTYIEKQLSNKNLFAKQILNKNKLNIVNRPEISIQSAGDRKSFQSTFFLGIIFYIFSKKNVDLKSLPIPIKENQKELPKMRNNEALPKIGNNEVLPQLPKLDNNGSSQKINENGLTEADTVKTPSKSTRIVSGSNVIYLFGFEDESQYILKILADKPENVNEFKIYEELQNFLKSPEKSHIVNMVKADVIDKTEDIKLNFEVNNENYEIEFDSFMYEIIESLIFTEKIVYIITDYDSDFITLNDAKKKNKPQLDLLCRLLNNVIIFYNYLYKNLGFLHQDLHTNNLLVKKDYTDFKFFDFDRSSTKKNNSELLTPKESDEMFLTDIARMVGGVLVGYDGTCKNDNLRNLLEIATKYSARLTTGLQISQSDLDNFLKLVNELEKVKSGGSLYEHKYNKYKGKYLELKNKMTYA